MMNILILERKPVFRTSERGSSSTSHTMFEHLSPIKTSENLLGAFTNSCKHLRQIVTPCSFYSVVNWWGPILQTSCTDQAAHG